MNVEEQIAKYVGEVRTESFDMSFGEILNLHSNNELIIQPEYQRLFRWSPQQKSHLIESILLELPVPQIFVIENENGVFELIDGLQRVSTILQFIDHETLELEELSLDGCSLISKLNGMSYEDLPLSLRLRIKRSPIRTVVIKKQSKGFLRYEMFKRLNTGGSNLEPQEIRNCSARMLGEHGVTFYSLLVKLSESPDFAACAEYIPQAERDKKGAEELVLRYFATKNYLESFKGSVRDWLDNYMEDVLLDKEPFDRNVEAQDFRETMRLAREKLGDEAFLRFRGDNPVGSLPPAYFEAISVALHQVADQVHNRDASELRRRITRLVQTNDFREVTGPGANSKEKLRRRIQLVRDALIAD